jgi:hypothetical protein
MCRPRRIIIIGEISEWCVSVRRRWETVIDVYGTQSMLRKHRHACHRNVLRMIWVQKSWKMKAQALIFILQTSSRQFSRYQALMRAWWSVSKTWRMLRSQLAFPSSRNEIRYFVRIFVLFLLDGIIFIVMVIFQSKMTSDDKSWSTADITHARWIKSSVNELER